MKFRPETLGFRVIIKPYIKKKTDSGILIATSERNQAINADKGIIVMMGPEAFKAFKFDNPFQVGDRVYYAKYGAKVLKDTDMADDEENLYIICNDEDLLVGYTDNDR